MQRYGSLTGPGGVPPQRRAEAERRWPAMGLEDQLVTLAALTRQFAALKRNGASVKDLEELWRRVNALRQVLRGEYDARSRCRGVMEPPLGHCPFPTTRRSGSAPRLSPPTVDTAAMGSAGSDRGWVHAGEPLRGGRLVAAEPAGGTRVPPIDHPRGWCTAACDGEDRSEVKSPSTARPAYNSYRGPKRTHGRRTDDVATTTPTPTPATAAAQSPALSDAKVAQPIHSAGTRFDGAANTDRQSVRSATTSSLHEAVIADRNSFDGLVGGDTADRTHTDPFSPSQLPDAVPRRSRTTRAVGGPIDPETVQRSVLFAVHLAESHLRKEIVFKARSKLSKLLLQFKDGIIRLREVEQRRRSVCCAAVNPASTTAIPCVDDVDAPPLGSNMGTAVLVSLPSATALADHPLEAEEIPMTTACAAPLEDPHEVAKGRMIASREHLFEQQRLALECEESVLRREVRIHLDDAIGDIGARFVAAKLACAMRESWRHGVSSLLSAEAAARAAVETEEDQVAQALARQERSLMVAIRDAQLEAQRTVAHSRGAQQTAVAVEEHAARVAAQTEENGERQLLAATLAGALQVQSLREAQQRRWLQQCICSLRTMEESERQWLVAHEGRLREDMWEWLRVSGAHILERQRDASSTASLRGPLGYLEEFPSAAPCDAGPLPPFAESCLSTSAVDSRAGSRRAEAAMHGAKNGVIPAVLELQVSSLEDSSRTDERKSPRATQPLPASTVLESTDRDSSATETEACTAVEAVTVKLSLDAVELPGEPAGPLSPREILVVEQSHSPHRSRSSEELTESRSPSKTSTTSRSGSTEAEHGPCPTDSSSRSSSQTSLASSGGEVCEGNSSSSSAKLLPVEHVSGFKVVQGVMPDEDRCGDAAVLSAACDVILAELVRHAASATRTATCTVSNLRVAMDTTARCSPDCVLTLKDAPAVTGGHARRRWITPRVLAAHVLESSEAVLRKLLLSAAEVVADSTQPRHITGCDEVTPAAATDTTVRCCEADASMADVSLAMISGTVTVDAEEVPPPPPSAAPHQCGSPQDTVAESPPLFTTPATSAQPIKPTLVAEAKPSAEDTPTDKATPASMATPTVKATPTDEVAPTDKATPTEKATPTGKATPTEKVTPTGKATPTDEVAPTDKATPTSMATPTGNVTPTDEATQTCDAAPIPVVENGGSVEASAQRASDYDKHSPSCRGKGLEGGGLLSRESADEQTSTECSEGTTVEGDAGDDEIDGDHEQEHVAASSEATMLPRDMVHREDPRGELWRNIQLVSFEAVDRFIAVAAARAVETAAAVSVRSSRGDMKTCVVPGKGFSKSAVTLLSTCPSEYHNRDGKYSQLPAALLRVANGILTECFHEAALQRSHLIRQPFSTSGGDVQNHAKTIRQFLGPHDQEKFVADTGSHESVDTERRAVADEPATETGAGAADGDAVTESECIGEEERISDSDEGAGSVSGSRTGSRTTTVSDRRMLVARATESVANGILEDFLHDAAVALVAAYSGTTPRLALDQVEAPADDTAPSHFGTLSKSEPECDEITQGSVASPHVVRQRKTKMLRLLSAFAIRFVNSAVRSAADRQLLLLVTRDAQIETLTPYTNEPRILAEQTNTRDATADDVCTVAESLLGQWISDAAGASVRRPAGIHQPSPLAEASTPAATEPIAHLVGGPGLPDAAQHTEKFQVRDAAVAKGLSVYLTTTAGAELQRSARGVRSFTQKVVRSVLTSGLCAAADASSLMAGTAAGREGGGGANPPSRDSADARVYELACGAMAEKVALDYTYFISRRMMIAEEDALSHSSDMSSPQTSERRLVEVIRDVEADFRSLSANALYFVALSLVDASRKGMERDLNVGTMRDNLFERRATPFCSPGLHGDGLPAALSVTAAAAPFPHYASLPLGHDVRRAKLSSALLEATLDNILATLIAETSEWMASELPQRLVPQSE